jgi:N-acetylglucosaminyldiphosphoundecaprenol N-acetyl-beta-D-mannosaminyltransferase
MSMRRKVLGIWINCITMEDTVGHCLRIIRGDRSPRVIATLNAALLVMARDDPRLAHALRSSDLVLADGMPVLWIARALGARSARRVTGVDLMEELLRIASREGLRLYFLGATPEVLGALVERVATEHGGALIVGQRDGYFPRDRDDEVIGEIRASRADILFVGMPSPFKEVWSHEHREALGAPVILPVGGAFDVLSGAVRRAPGVLQACGMEWLWRMAMDPRTKWRRYVETNPVFLVLVARAVSRRLVRSLPFRRRSRRPRPPAHDTDPWGFATSPE